MMTIEEEMMKAKAAYTKKVAKLNLKNAAVEKKVNDRILERLKSDAHIEFYHQLYKQASDELIAEREDRSRKAKAARLAKVGNGDEIPGRSRISMTEHGSIEITAASGRKLSIDEAGEVTVWRMQGDGETRISVDDSVSVEFQHAESLVTVAPDGWIEQFLAEPIGQLEAKDPAGYIDRIIEFVKSRDAVTVADLADELDVTLRTALDFLIQARRKDPQAFVEASAMTMPLVPLEAHQRAQQ